MDTVESKLRPSPEIALIQWGHIEVKTPQKNKLYKDAKLFPGGSKKWDWNETGTEHWAGIQPGDLDDLLYHGAQIVILSQGYYNRLRVSEKTNRKLEETGVDYHILETREAVEKYNELVHKNLPVAALIHSTC